MLDFLRIAWGGSNSLATAVLGAFPIVLGLSFWQGLAASFLGVLVGGLLLAPLALFGPMTGTNNAVSSSAHFGVVGRIVGSLLSLLTAVAFFSISVWSSGDALVGAAHRLVNLPGSERVFAGAYAIFALAVLGVSIYGFRLMLWVSKVAVVTSSLLFLLGFWAYFPMFDSHFTGAGHAWGDAGFWPVFVSAFLIVLANPISFGAFLGDWTRYLPRSTSKGRLMAVTVLSQLLSLVPFAFGLFTTCVIAQRAPAFLEQVDYTGGLIAIAPDAYVLPLVLLALVSGMSTGVTSLYGTGLDFSSVVPRLSRARATLLIGAVSCALIFVGRFAFNLVDAITTFVSLIVVMTTPWMVVLVLGYVFRRGHYLPDALQVFNRGQVGGPYWFYRGWNLPGILTWLCSGTLALLTVDIPGHFVGWLGGAAGGVDISLLVAALLPLLLYPALLYLYPEPRGVFGPRGPRGVPCADVPLAPIIPRAGRAAAGCGAVGS